MPTRFSALATCRLRPLKRLEPLPCANTTSADGSEGRPRKPGNAQRPTTTSLVTIRPPMMDELVMGPLSFAD